MSKLIIAQSVVFLIMSESSRTSPSSNCQKMRWKWRFPPSFSWQHIVSSPQVAANQIASLSLWALTFLHHMQQEHQCVSTCNKNICSVCLHSILSKCRCLCTFIFSLFSRGGALQTNTYLREDLIEAHQTPQCGSRTQVWWKEQASLSALPVPAQQTSGLFHPSATGTCKNLTFRHGSN